MRHRGERAGTGQVDQGAAGAGRARAGSADRAVRPARVRAARARRVHGRGHRRRARDDRLPRRAHRVRARLDRRPGARRDAHRRPRRPEGYAYRALYAAPALLGDGTLGTALPYFPVPVLHDPELAAALRRAHTDLSARPDPLEAESRLPWLLAALARRHPRPVPSPAPSPAPGPSRSPSATASPTSSSPRPPSETSQPTSASPATSCSARSVRRWACRRTRGSPSTG